VNVFINHLVNEISPRDGAVRALRRLLESNTATRQALKVTVRSRSLDARSGCRRQETGVSVSFVEGNEWVVGHVLWI
jgi:hypothetical protein